ncbi:MULTISPECIES: Cu(I)-responsive transcriptional regulator [Psychrobacter]|jgi:MerR family copper efflux transcriptional regulator|uniref:Cu(I)-responsive transcriptional regulator n=5 Tax=Psychrobacter TaxID=497 RepID=A0ABT6IW11_9GAMM|nr:MULTISPECIES: Cu(I)-responsive transcriptional regulator [Pseudomonadota]EGK12619.1 CspA family transcriptional regulator [Psychrobacter sp. 1501(2011)]MDN5646003.1 Cu(I)-responsive transcriptional regulator [Acinetobacter sp.]NOX77497.1 Cu(I)-responsive transcriptional regulator [Gammaproteobacteria bacterium]AOY44354.1 transcriptional regulator [Psychrobacter sp. AntiMn-1]MCD9151832.1 Cu(I)-responsive transcriptional regulator [Psychrobacter sanguinis]
MNIGQASERSGISPKMIRYYEQIGLLDTAKRSNSGYRIYSNQDIKNLCFLRQARDLGFSSKQMKELLNLWKNTDRQSADVKKLTLTHIETLNRKIAQLQDMVSLLQISADHCSGNENAECAILEDLEQGE